MSSIWEKKKKIKKKNKEFKHLKKDEILEIGQNDKATSMIKVI
jgi:hypothetical protein